MLKVRLKFRNLLIVCMPYWFFGCASSINSLDSASPLTASDSNGYLGVSFQNTSQWNCYVSLEDTLTKKSYFLNLDNPKEENSTVSILGKAVYNSNPNKRKPTVIPLPPGSYKVGHVEIRAFRETHFGSGTDKIITIKPKSLTYIGEITPSIFVLIFAWKIDFSAQDNFETDKSYFSNNLALIKEITSLN